MIKRWIIHLLLILFFIANGMNGYADLVSWSEPFILFGILIFLAALSGFIGVLLFRDRLKALLASFILLFFLLFSRVIFTVLKEHLFPMLNATLFLLVCLVTISLKMFWLKKLKPESLEKSARSAIPDQNLFQIPHFQNLIFRKSCRQ